MSGVDNYARQMNTIGNQIQALLKECRTDNTISMEQREDISWEIVRAKEILAQCTASLVSIAVKVIDE